MDTGGRACLAGESSSIYDLNLRGNARTSGEMRRAEGHNVFNQGSRAQVAIVILVRNPMAPLNGCRIHYHDIGDYLQREKKLAILRRAGSIAGLEDRQTITPNRYHDWTGKRDETFQGLYPIGSKYAKAGKADDALYTLYSSGYKTSRDAYIDNFSHEACAENARRMVEDCLGALRDFKEGRNRDLVEDIVRCHSQNVRWDRELKNNLQRGKAVTNLRDRVWTTGEDTACCGMDAPLDRVHMCSQ